MATSKVLPIEFKSSRDPAIDGLLEAYDVHYERFTAIGKASGLLALNPTSKPSGTIYYHPAYAAMALGALPKSGKAELHPDDIELLHNFAQEITPRALMIEALQKFYVDVVDRALWLERPQGERVPYITREFMPFLGVTADVIPQTKGYDRHISPQLTRSHVPLLPHEGLGYASGAAQYAKWSIPGGEANVTEVGEGLSLRCYKLFSAAQVATTVVG